MMPPKESKDAIEIHERLARMEAQLEGQTRMVAILLDKIEKFEGKLDGEISCLEEKDGKRNEDLIKLSSKVKHISLWLYVVAAAALGAIVDAVVGLIFKN